MPEEVFETFLAEFVTALLANSWFTNRETKRLLAESEGLNLKTGLAHELYRHPGPAPDMQQRIEGFAAKTPNDRKG